MAKKKKPSETQCNPIEWKPPSPAEQRRSAAKHFARVVLDTDPDRRKEENEIANAVLRVAQGRSD